MVAFESLATFTVLYVHFTLFTDRIHLVILQTLLFRSCCRYTLTVSFSKMVSETNDLAGQRELIAEYLQSEVLKPMHELIKSTQTDRKKLMQEGAELHRSLKESMDTLDKVIYLNLYFYTCTLYLVNVDYCQVDLPQLLTIHSYITVQTKKNHF